MDKKTADYFKNILNEEQSDYSRAQQSAGLSFGKLKYYFSQFKDIQIYDITQKNWNQQLEINIENWLKNKQKN